MTSVNFPLALAGTTALALLMGPTAFAQQQTTGNQAQTAPAAEQSGQVQDALAQVEQLLQQAGQSLQQDDAKTARMSLEEANKRLRQPAGAAGEQAMLDLQSQIEQALSAIDGEDMETAQSSVQNATDTLMEVQQAATGKSGEQSTQQAVQAPAPKPAQQPDGQTMTVDQTTGQQAAGQQQVALTPTMEQGSQIDQQTLDQLRDELEMAQMDLRSAMDAVASARHLLDGMTPAMAAAQGVQQGVQQGTQQAAEANRDIPRLSADETHRLLSVGDRQIGEASEMMVVTVSDIEDRDVLSYEGERIGEVGGIVNNGGKPYAIIEHGGFLGIGENEVAVPLARLGLRGDDLILLGLSEEQMKALPDYDYKAGEKLGDEDTIEIGLYQ